MAKVNTKLPILVTRNLMPFPGVETVIEIAREYSVNAVNDATYNCNNDILIFTQIHPEQEPSVANIYPIGCIAKVVASKEFTNYIRVRFMPSSRAKFKTFDYNSSEKFFFGSYELLEDKPGDELEQLELIKSVFKHTPGLLRDVSKFSDPIKIYNNDLGKEYINTVCYKFNMTAKDRQALLTIDSINERALKLLKIINMDKEIAEIDKKISEAMRQSMDKSQKEYILREKMKQINKELGDEDVDEILDKLDKNPYPEHIKKKIKEEYKKYQSMPGASLEASLSKQYIDTLLNLPWYQKTEDNDDLINARKILDEDHFGLDKVKDRIIEYLAVKKTTGNLKAPILCFYGAPGVGKTSLGKSVARALGRKFFKASLGGISDEAEIRGHRRTYVGALPGRIIAGMKKSGVKNPVFLLDEIDKLASNYKGDPASALLEVLDPEQNNAFNDNYVEEPFDLSDVLFIGTANYLEDVPAPLRDRLEIIELSSYTELEKIQIAKNFLVKKELLANGLKFEDYVFSDDAIKYIINHYTMEAGVRNLERNIAKVIRKIIVENLTSKDKKQEGVRKVEIEDVKKYLGVEKIMDTEKEKEDQVGVVTGLAYTEYGGSTLPIEVNYFPGKGNLILTGKLGDVMKESASIALDYVKANSKKYNIDFELFSNNDIHIHFPEGAIPKDGPSAGVAISIAILSCFQNKKVSCDVAMTGEVNLRGSALPIGGLREKSLAALRNGIKKIIVPLKNKRDVDELPKEVKDNLEIIYMTCVDDAVKHAILND